MLYQLSYQVKISVLSFALSGCKYKFNNLFNKSILQEIYLFFEIENKTIIFIKTETLKIILVGYMGSGKSTVGKALAQFQKIEFIDLDSYIETQEGITIPEIFSTHGEIYFRKKEGEYLKEILAKKEDLILATGGGTPCYGFNLKEMLAATPNVCYLKLSLPNLVGRLAKEKEHRPLIQNIPEDELIEFIGKHLFERSFFYNQAPLKVTCDTYSPEEIAQKILQSLV